MDNNAYLLLLLATRSSRRRDYVPALRKTCRICDSRIGAIGIRSRSSCFVVIARDRLTGRIAVYQNDITADTEVRASTAQNHIAIDCDETICQNDVT
jgi:hypothetical protein